MALSRGFIKSIAKLHPTRIAHTSTRKLSTRPQPSSDLDPLFNYTSGRWFWNEHEQLKARFKRFNVQNLQQVACEAVGAKQCISISKVGEGHFNKAYRMEMDDGRNVIAKIPHPNAGPAMLTTASEVATMDFVRTVLHLPVPKVIAFSATEQNPVEAEYIIMEEAKGLQLPTVWKDHALEEKFDVISDIVDMESKLLSLSFDKIGSIYFSDSGVAGYEPAVVTSGPKAIRDYIRSRYCIGPITRRVFWEQERGTMHEHHGPWNTAIEYFQAITRREIDWIKKFAGPHNTPKNQWQYTGPGQEDPTAHISALEKLHSAIPLITPKNSNLTTSRLWHPGFHAKTIYLDAQHRVSSITDWQSTWTGPVFLNAKTPGILDYTIEVMMNPPENFEQLDADEKEKIRYQVFLSNLIQCYQLLTKERNPLMDAMMLHPPGETLKKLEIFANTSWDNRLMHLQECLLRVEREWTHFDTTAPCPYTTSAAAIERHRAEADAFNMHQELWEGLVEIMSDDGYTSNETHGATVEVLVHLRKAGLGRLEGEDRREFDEWSRWIEGVE